MILDLDKYELIDENHSFISGSVREDIDKLISIAGEDDYRVKIYKYSPRAQIVFQSKYATSTLYYGEKQCVYILAHELGHLVQFKKGRKEEKYRSWKSYSDYSKRIRNNKMLFVMHELDAWIKGYKLLKKNKINTNGYWLMVSFGLNRCIKDTKGEDTEEKASLVLLIKTSVRVSIYYLRYVFRNLSKAFTLE